MIARGGYFEWFEAAESATYFGRVLSKTGGARPVEQDLNSNVSG